MTTTSPTSPTAEHVQRRPVWVVPLIVVVGVVVALMWTSGGDADEAHWTTGHASVTGTQATIDADGWTFGPSGSVPSWIDRGGSWHEATWPDCLPDGTDADVRVAWVPFELDGGTDRLIVAVDCRG